jgi:hypothetical protein
MHTKKLATVLVLGALALAPTAQPSQAADASASSRTASVARAVVRPLVQGLVVDQSGRYLDDVNVEALRANGNIAASSLTYASTRHDGPQHGYFYLEVGGPGDYTLRLAKKGYVTRTFPVGQVRRRQIVSLGEIKLTRVVTETKTSAKLKDSSISPDQKGKVDVTVATKATKKPTGGVEVRDGSKVLGSDTLVPGDKGAVTITLKKLAKGSYHLKAYFLGSKTLKKSTSGALTLTVKKPKHRPNAW